jgi:predicted DNA binding CopG/RHH family protein
MNTTHTKTVPIRVTPEEHTKIKLDAFKAGITIQKHVRLKLGLDKEGKK